MEAAYGLPTGIFIFDLGQGDCHLYFDCEYMENDNRLVNIIIAMEFKVV